MKPIGHYRATLTITPSIGAAQLSSQFPGTERPFVGGRFPGIVGDRGIAKA